jgi:autotransporter-associated beta strand protein
MNMKKKSGFLLALAMMLLVATGAQATSDAWNMDASGNWDAGGNWLGSSVPGSTTADNTDVATFSYTLTADCIITVDAPRYIGGLSFGNTSAFKYTLSSGALQLNNGGVIQTLAANGDHTDTIDTPIQLDGATAFFTANAASASSLLSIGAVTGSATVGNTTTLTLNGSNPGANAVTGVIGDGSGGGKLALVKNSAGVWRLSGQNAYQGGTTVNAGTVDVYGDQSAATGGWIIGPTSVNLVTNNFKSGSTIVVAAGKSIQVGHTTSSGNDYTIVNVSSAVTNQGSFLVGRAATVNLYSGTKWQQAGDMSITGYGGRIENLNVNSGSTFDYIGANTIKVNPAYNNSGGAVLTIRGLFNTQQAFERTETVSTGYGRLTLSSGGRLKLTGPVETLTLYPDNKPLQFTLDNGGGMIDTDTNNTAITCVISGSGTLTKSGTGMLTLTNANTYTGFTTNDAGTLRLVGGNNRLRNTGTLVFSDTSTLDVDTTSQTLSALLFPNTTMTATINGAGGALTVNGASDMELGPGGTLNSSPTVTVNMSDLSTFTYDASGNTFRVGLKNTVVNNVYLGQVALVTLAKTNTIRATNFYVGDRGANSDGGISTLHLGQKNTLSVNSINSGYSGRSDTQMDFASGLSNPTVTIRNTDGSSAVANWSIGSIGTFTGAGQSTFTDTISFLGGTLDAVVTTLTMAVADAMAQANRAGTENASFAMGDGSLTVSTLNLGKIANTGGDGTTTGTVGGTYRANATFSLNGGSVSASTITLAENTITDVSSFTKSTSGTFILSNGTLRASTVQKGPQTGTATATTSFRCVAGTIGNISGSDLVWTNIPLTLQTAASHVFDITGANTATLDANSPISGSGCALTKTGTGTLRLCGANTYNGGTTVSNGTLVAGGNNALASGSDLILSGGGFDTGSYANTLDMLTVSDSTMSQLLVSDPGCLLSFTGMEGTGTLTITGTLGSTSVRFGTSDSALTGEQLSRINVNGFPAALSVAGYLREVRGTVIQFR